MQVAGMWIYPRARMKKMADGIEWIMTRAPGGAYTPDWMVQAAIDEDAQRLLQAAIAAGFFDPADLPDP